MMLSKDFKQDLFYKIITEGVLKMSGLGVKHEPYRLFYYKGKAYRLTLKTEEQQKTLSHHYNTIIKEVKQNE